MPGWHGRGRLRPGRLHVVWLPRSRRDLSDRLDADHRGVHHPSAPVRRRETVHGELGTVGGIGIRGRAGVLATALVDGQLVHKSRRWSIQRRISELRDHHILCGYGRVGRAAAREFDADGVPFVVIEINPELENDLRRDGVLYLIGNASSEALLRAAGISRARGLVCAVDSDAENVYITLAARTLNPDISIVARASEQAAADRLYRAGADRVVSPYATSGRRMALLARQPDLVDLFDLTRGGAAALRIEELLISKDSPLVGQTLAQVCGSATALLIRRADGQLLPNPTRDTVVQSGDVVVIFGEPDALRPRE